jgi:hypothetical protein
LDRRNYLAVAGEIEKIKSVTIKKKEFFHDHMKEFYKSRSNSTLSN